MELAHKIEVALGKYPVDLLLKNGRLVNVFSGEIHEASVAVHEGIIAGFGDYDAQVTIDLGGAYIVPGFIDGHLHIESSMLSIPEFAANVATSWHYRGCGGPARNSQCPGRGRHPLHARFERKRASQGVRHVPVLRSGHTVRDFRRGADPYRHGRFQRQRTGPGSR